MNLFIPRPTSGLQPGKDTPATSYRYDSRAHQLAEGALNTAQAASRHQLPPMVRLTLIAVDESSWAQWAPSEAQVEGLMSEINDRFRIPASYEDDLQEVSEYLTHTVNL